MEKDMTVFDISELSALEILDSRGRPTLATTLRLGDGTQARAGVPSGVRPDQVGCGAPRRPARSDRRTTVRSA
jgi:hypothetical protein